MQLVEAVGSDRIQQEDPVLGEFSVVEFKTLLTPLCRLSSIRTSAFPTKEKTTLSRGQLQQERTLQTTGDPRQPTKPIRGSQMRRNSVFPDSSSPRTSFSG